jgi:hypothetical protein
MKSSLAILATLVATQAARAGVPYHGIVVSSAEGRHTIQLEDQVEAQEGAGVDFYFTVPGDDTLIPVSRGHLVAGGANGLAVAVSDYGAGQPQPGNLVLIRPLQPGDATFQWIHDRIREYRGQLTWLCTAILLLAILAKRPPHPS